MAELFEVAELVKVAVEDEKTGVAFYTRLAAKCEKLKDVFERLAEEEKVHQARFEQMLVEIGSHQPREHYPGEYSDYLKTLTTTRAFPDEQTAIRMADQCADDDAAPVLAGRFEKDTLILMSEMRKLIPDEHREIIDELTKEEQGHLVTLAEARLSLS